MVSCLRGPVLSTGPRPSGILAIQDCIYMPQQMRQSQGQEGNPALDSSLGLPAHVYFPALSGGQMLVLLPLAVVGISSTFEPCDPVHLQSVLPFTGPLVRCLDSGETPLEAGHDVAREQFIAMQSFFARRPVGDPDHKATKPPAHFLQPFDASDAIVWRANEPLIMFNHEIDHLMRRDIGRRIPQS